MQFLIPDEHKRSSGIYIIRNSIDNKVYVGSAKDFRRRFCEHYRNIKGLKHPNTKLIRAINKHGLENFSFSLLELCTLDVLIAAEQKWINHFNAVKKGYNIAPYAGTSLGRIAKESTKAKIRLSQLGRTSTEKQIEAGRMNMKRLCELKGFRKINQYTLDSILIKTWDNYKELVSATGYTIPNIRGCCKGWHNTAYGYLWAYKDSGKTPVFVPRKTESKKRIKINQFTKDGTLVKCWDSITIAADAFGINSSNICSCCKGKKKSVVGFVWRYKGDSFSFGIHKAKKVKVVQFDKNGTLIKEHNALEHAAKDAGTTGSNIWMVCNGRRKTAGGFKWQYA